MTTRRLFKVTIELGNDAMDNGYHVAGALLEIAKQVGIGHQKAGSVHDDNGNTVGSFEYRTIDVESLTIHDARRAIEDR
jgi:hypothetical protein